MAEKEFDWKKFQEHNKYTDEEMEIFKADPRRAKAAPKIFSKEIGKKTLVFEVVESHGCTVGMKPGDKLVFNGLGALNTKESSRWCAQALDGIGGVATMIQDRFVSGLDLNDTTYEYISCGDVGAKRGWGQVIMRYYVRDES